MGSLAAAAASFLRARQASGEWVLRVEDIDPPREVKGASASFLTTLETFGFEWDGPVIYQSDRFDLYRKELIRLVDAKQVFRCTCSRRTISATITAQNGPAGVYPGTCRGNQCESAAPTNWRLFTHDQEVHFTDLLQGEQRVRYGHDLGDFVVWRKNDLPSYQLAATVDDLNMGITEVVRGIDLLNETAGQILLRQALAEPALPPQPTWLHIPMVVNPQGYKLSKQTAAPPLDCTNVAQQLCVVLKAIGLPVEDALRRAAVRDIWQYAIEHWQPKALLNKQITTLD